MRFTITSLFLVLFASLSFAQNSCDFTIQGGVDTWPWNVAQPFPWNTIQGVWKLNSDSSNTFFRIKVTNSTSDKKILAVEKVTVGNCKYPVAKGIGYMNSSEKNVVRMIMSDKTLRYQLTLGMFDTKVLASNGISVCGDQVLIANMQVIGHVKYPQKPISIDQFQAEMMMLKKIPGSIDSICKKQRAH